TGDEALRIMVQEHIRHLPVVDEQGRPQAIVSMRSLLEEKVNELHQQLDSLHSYMSADGIGGQLTRPVGKNMRSRIQAIFLIATTLVVINTRSNMTSAAAQTTVSRVTSPQLKRTAEGKPDFSGIWQANTTAYWDIQTHEARPMVAQAGVYPDVPVLAAPVVALGTVGWVPPGLGVVEGDEIPYQAWAADRKRENAANWLDRDPELKCYMPGVPRAMYLPYPFQILQS